MRTADALALSLSALLSLSCGNVAGDADAGGPSIDADNGDGGAGGADAAVPVISAIVPDWGPLAGGTEVTITGSGFSAGGTPTVTFGDNDGTDVNVVSDTELTVVTPNGPHAQVDVTVSNDNGSTGGLMFRYLAALYAAPSMGNKNGTLPGNLFSINPATGGAVSIGPLGVPITGMALSPDGVLFGIRPGVYGGGGKLAAGPIPGAPPIPMIGELYTINPYTAAVTLIGQLHDGDGLQYHVVAGIAFIGATLYGWNEDGPVQSDTLVQIDPATAECTEIGVNTVGTSGTGFTSDPTGRLLATFGGVINVVNPADGVVTPGPALNPNLGSVNAITFVGSQMYGSRKAGGGDLALAPGALMNAELVSIDHSTGAVTVIGFLPDNIDALCGIPTIAAAGPPPVTPPAAVAPRRANAPVPTASALTVRAGDRVLLAGVPAALELAPLADGVAGARALEIATVADSLRVDLATVKARGLRLKLNQRGLYKLMDGAGNKLGEGVITIRVVD
jgi:hypothetical protein